MATQVSPSTGRPVIEEQVQKREKENSLDREREQRATALTRDLASPQGQAVMNYIRAELHHRIDELVAQDPKCSAYLDLLKEMGITIMVGEEAGNRLIRKMIGK